MEQFVPIMGGWKLAVREELASGLPKFNPPSVTGHPSRPHTMCMQRPRAHKHTAVPASRVLVQSFRFVHARARGGFLSSELSSSSSPAEARG